MISKIVKVFSIENVGYNTSRRNTIFDSWIVLLRKNGEENIIRNFILASNCSKCRKWILQNVFRILQCRVEKSNIWEIERCSGCSFEEVDFLLLEHFERSDKDKFWSWSFLNYLWRIIIGEPISLWKIVWKSSDSLTTLFPLWLFPKLHRLDHSFRSKCQGWINFRKLLNPEIETHTDQDKHWFLCNQFECQFWDDWIICLCVWNHV